MDFYQIKERSTKNGVIEVYPDFKVCRSKDLMVRGKSFYAIWNEAKGMWSTDEYDVQHIVDTALLEHRDKLVKKTDGVVQVKLMSNFSSKAWAEFKSYMSHMSDNAKQLDEKLTFANTDVKKKDHVSKRLNYELGKGDCSGWDELIGTLYDPEERAKLEWAIGAIVSGDAKSIQKFLVLYGEAGAGKSTILNIIQKLFSGYYTTFEAKALTASSNAFSTEVFKTNPLVAIQHDGDLSKIEDNTKLNSIVSHEEMTLNEKYKPSYMSRINAFLFMGTNKPVKITDAKSGIIRRLIDVTPSGRKLPPKHYQAVMQKIDFELGSIAQHCLDVYRSMGKNYYSDYKPLSMIFQTDVFFNFVEDHYSVFKNQEGVTLTQAYKMYKTHCEESMVKYTLSRHKFREELKNYFGKFDQVARVDGKQIRSYYSEFLTNKFTSITKDEPIEEHQSALVMDQTESLLDNICANDQAQYATSNGTPKNKWEKVSMRLSDIDTSKIHYVKPPLNHIVIDFDIKDEEGNKSLEKNIEAASKWPPTYAEISKGGNGIHLHYIYDGDPEKLSRVYDKDIEVKVFVGNSSLRRKLTKCNNIEIATISSGLPLKGVKMINHEAVKNERHLRSLIEKNLRKEIHPGTKPSIDFIHKILEDAYNSGVGYDVTDMAPKVLAFANNSSNQPEYCVRLVSEMKFRSEQPSQGDEYDSEELVHYDVEVFPNLFVIVWKFDGKPEKVKMINPTPLEVEALLKLKLIGFNVRRYDNHIIYAASIGYTVEQLYNLSQKIINNEKNALFAEAYGLSYVDIYEMSSKKQSLKKFEIELGIHHLELGLPWDKPVPKELWPKVVEYCCNDVDATEAVFHARKDDFVARQILAELSGLAVNDTTQKHAARIIFGKDRKAQDKFIYTDLSEEFPGYTFSRGKSNYRGEDPGEGGYVYAKPDMYGNVGLFDVASMHPTSAVIMNIFGEYTKNYKDIMDARLAIKHDDVELAKDILSGLLSRTRGVTKKEARDILENIFKKFDISNKDLSYALKIVINIVYGMTSAKFDNPFRDKRNKDNIVAKRGALFMIDLKHAVEEQGYKVAHIKTDSIKVPDADEHIAKFIYDFGQKYGYDFEHEATYDKMCLVNDAVYIAKYDGTHPKKPWTWTATGAQFAHPYVFKALFSKEPITFKDMCETKSTTTSLYLDMNEGYPDVTVFDITRKVRDKIRQDGEAAIEKFTIKDQNTWNAWKHLSDEELDDRIAEGHNYHFVGKVGSFCPIKLGAGGGILLREKDGKYYAATGTKGYRWLEAEMVEQQNKQDEIDQEFFGALVDAAVKNIGTYGDFEWFASEDPYDVDNNGIWPF